MGGKRDGRHRQTKKGGNGKGRMVVVKAGKKGEHNVEDWAWLEVRKWEGKGTEGEGREKGVWS